LKISKSSYYRFFKIKFVIATKGNRGRKPRGYCYKTDGSTITDEEFREKLRKIYRNKNKKDSKYYLKTMGSRKLAAYFREEEEIIINHKKLHRIRKEEKMVGKYIKKSRKKVRRSRAKKVERANQLWEVDIKYFHTEKKGNIALLDIIDVFDRTIVCSYIGKRCTHEDFIECLHIGMKIRGEKPQEIRTDNGSQFTALGTGKYLNERGTRQEFGLIHNPDSQAYIESQHANLKREFSNLNVFIDRKDLYEKYIAYMYFYHNLRPHKSLNYKTPHKYSQKTSYHVPVYVKR
jgi:transposase InsO family protein